MGAIVEKLKSWWQLADKTQRLVTVFGVAFLVAIIGMTVMFAGRPDLQPVYTGLSQEENSSVYDELMKAGFNPRIEKNGDVLINSNEIPRAKMALATANKLPKSGSSSIELIETIGISDSQRKEQAKLKAAVERELESSIASMNGVGSVKVHLNPGKDSPFGDQKVPATASVHISESSEGELSIQSGTAIARLVRGAVLGMQPTGISVITDAGRIVFDGEDQNSATSIASKKIEAEAKEALRRQKDLQQELDQVFGMGNTRVMIDLQLNMDSITEQKNEEITGDSPTTEETAKESMTSSVEQSGPGVGLEQNNPAEATPGSADPQKEGSGYTSEVKSKTYPTSKVNTNTIKAQGELVSMNVSVMANSAIITDIKPLQQRVSQYVAPWKGNPKFSSAVTAVEFNTTASEAATKAAASAASAQKMQQVLSLLPVLALVGVGFLLMRSLGKALKQPNQQLVLSNGSTYSLPNNVDPELVNIIKKNDEQVNTVQQAPTPVAEPQPEPEEETEMTEAERRAVMRAMGIDENDETVDVAAIKRKIDVPLEQIKKMSQKNPEAVAMLLKTWVMEDN